jgi:ATP-dependent RNA helicase RhlB
MSDTHLSDISFNHLHLPEVLARGIADAGFERCTPIQAQTLPRALAGFDIAGQAQTGTGKTAAFLVAMYSNLLRKDAPADRPVNAPRALIIAPTRELAVQIHHDAEILGQYTGLTLGLAFGGVDYEKQRRILEDGVDVLIGTPGRLIDFYKQRVFDLRAIQVVILDEADRMFDLGFITDIRYIMRRLPAPDQRLNMLFSATLAQRVLELAFEHMNDPELVRIEPDKMTVDRVRQVVYYPSMDEKPRLLVGLLRQMDPHRTMVFVNTRRGADELEALLKANGFNAQAMSGDVPQTKRLRMIRDFHSGELAILIGTDVASRGLHIPDVSHVFNYDLPQDPEDYVHRIGRTARAGAEGDAISLGCEDFVQSLPDIEDYIGRKIPVASVAQELLAEITVPRYERRSFGGPGGPRGGRGGPGGGRSGGPRSGGGGRGGPRGSGPRRDGGHGAPRPAPARAPQPASQAADPGHVARAEPPAQSAPRSAPATAGEGGGEGAPRKRRRRGGRGRSGRPQGDGATPPDSGGDQGPGADS